LFMTLYVNNYNMSDTTKLVNTLLIALVRLKVTDKTGSVKLLTRPVKLLTRPVKLLTGPLKFTAPLVSVYVLVIYSRGHLSVMPFPSTSQSGDEAV
jgi:hypothetical protein